MSGDTARKSACATSRSATQDTFAGRFLQQSVPLNVGVHHSYHNGGGVFLPPLQGSLRGGWTPRVPLRFTLGYIPAGASRLKMTMRFNSGTLQ